VIAISIAAFSFGQLEWISVFDILF